MGIKRFLWRVFDNVVFLQMGQTYQTQLKEFSEAGEGREGFKNVEQWRNEQQEEWDRLSTTLALLATIQAAILNVPHAPSFAYSAWFGGAGLSVCGVFIVQYFPIKAFSITDEEMKILVQDGNQYVQTSLLAVAIASPVVMALWASILFIAGVIDYIVRAEFLGARYRAFAAIP